MHRNETLARARALLARDIESVARLHSLLLEERAAVTGRELGALASVVQAKVECLRALEAQEQERLQLMRANRASDWGGLLASLDPALAADWKAFHGRLREVAEITETNEKIVNRTRRSTQKLLALLRGQGGEPVGVYDRSGRTHPWGDNRAITSA